VQKYLSAIGLFGQDDSININHTKFALSHRGRQQRAKKNNMRSNIYEKRI